MLYYHLYLQLKKPEPGTIAKLYRFSCSGKQKGEMSTVTGDNNVLE